MDNGVVYKIIKNEKQLNRIISYCKETGYASLDFETNGEPVHSSLGVPTILGVSFQPGSAYIIPLAHFDSCFLKQKQWQKILTKFGHEIVENENIVKICWNLKFEYKWFKRYGIEMRGRLFDGMLAKYLLREERPNDLKSITATYIPERDGYEKYEGSTLPWGEKPLQGLSKYCAIDCDSAFKLMLTFEPLLIKYDFYSLFRNMLMMATRVLGDSEFHGIPVDRPYLEKLLKKYKILIRKSQKALEGNKFIRRFNKWLTEDKVEKVIVKIEEEIEIIDDEIIELNRTGISDKIQVIINRKEKSVETREAKINRLLAKDFTTKKELEMQEPVNFNSPAQMIDLLFNSPKGFDFDIVNYTIDKKTKRATDRPSTDENVLLVLEEEDETGFITQLLKHRGLTKLYSTYILGMYEKLSENNYIHGRFLLHGTVTGRLSSRDPNLQNIPRDTTAADIKTMFIPPPGMVLMQLDYSQAELRVMAASAGETNMIHWFNIGRDIHLAVACDVMDWDYDWVKNIWDNDHSHKSYISIKIQRKKAKKINFGIIYGQMAKKLAAEMETTVLEAQKYINDYNIRFPKIAKFIKKQHKLVKKNAYVRNLFGRKRRLPNIDSPEWSKWTEAQRQSVNAPIQGAASDFTLFSSILIWEKIRTGELPNTIIQAYTVHDSLGYFIWPKDLHSVIPIMNKICKNPETKEWFGFQIKDVTMAVDFEVSVTNWKDLDDYDSTVDYSKLVAA